MVSTNNVKIPAPALNLNFMPHEEAIEFLGFLKEAPMREVRQLAAQSIRETAGRMNRRRYKRLVQILGTYRKAAKYAEHR